MGVYIFWSGTYFHEGYIFWGCIRISWRGTYFKGTKFLKWYNFSLISQGTYLGVYILSLGSTHLGRLSLGPTHLGRLSLGPTHLGRLSWGPTHLGRLSLGPTHLGRHFGHLSCNLLSGWHMKFKKCLEFESEWSLLNQFIYKSSFLVRFRICFDLTHLPIGGFLCCLVR